MKATNAYIIIIAALFLLPTNLLSQSVYHINYQAISDPNTVPPTYNDPEGFQTNQINSDFGRRRGNLSNWHKGVDYSVGQSIGYHILSLVDGEIKKLSGTGYKYIIIEGDQPGSEHHFGYGHLFEDDPPANRTMEIGDMVLIELPYPNTDEFAIINLNEEEAIAIGPTNNVTFTYNETEYTVTDAVNTDDPIGIIGNSGDDYNYQHVHLYMFEDIDDAVVNHNNIHNDKDPLEFVTHEDTEYDVWIFGKTLEINNQHYINQNDVVVFPGDEEISLMVRWEMEGDNTGSTYDNVVMNIDDVYLYIKSSYTPTEGSSSWGNEGSNYQLIQGPWVESKLCHGARIESDIYPTNIPPANPSHNTNPNLNIANDSNAEHGSITRTGIYPHAYYSNTSGYPYDDYYFSDFKTRIHNLEGFCMNNCGYAPYNEEAKYPDGTYQLFAKVTTVRGVEYTSLECTAQPPEIIIDNFCPYIKEVEMTQEWDYLPTTVYHFIWDWLPGPGQLEGNTVINIQAKPYLPISIKITSSEPLQHCGLAISSLGYQQTQPNPINAERTQWEFEITDFGIAPIGQHTLSITGFDMAGNQLQENPQTISIRQQMDKNRGTWDPPACPGPDENHTFEISSYQLAFDISHDMIFAGEETTVYITNNSSGYEGINYEWWWSFEGDRYPEGVIIGRHPPAITYTEFNSLGTYTISLTIMEDNIFIIDKLEKEIEIIDPETYLLVDFEAEGTTDDGELYGNSPFTINFSDASSGNPNEWLWDFGDGWGESIDQNPSYIFENYTGSPQQYAVTLQACNPDDCAVEMKEALITVYPQYTSLDPRANFSLSQTSLFAPCEVTITNNSSGDIDTWEWDLDGIGGYECLDENPGPIPIGEATNRNISLKVTNSESGDESVFSEQLIVYANPNSGYTVDFHWDPNPVTQGSLVSFNEDVTGFYYSYNCKWTVYYPGSTIPYEYYTHNPYLPFNETGAYDVYLEVFDLYNNFLGACSKQVYVTPPALVAAPGEIIPDDIFWWSHFGQSVAVDGNFAVVGSPIHDGHVYQGGAIYIYEFNPVNETWSKIQGPITPVDIFNTSYFGFSVAISGNYIVVGAPNHIYGVNSKGAVYVYKFNGVSWEQLPGNLIPDDAANNDMCGTSVDIDGGYLVVGTGGGVSYDGVDSLFDDGPKAHQGKAYIYKLENNSWVEKCKIFDENGFIKDGFGKSVSISGTRVTTGSDYNRAFVFDKISDKIWSQKTIIMEGEKNGTGPIKVSLSNNTLIVGHQEADCSSGGTGSECGEAYIYELSNDQWIKICNLQHYETDEANFGYSVSINGWYAVVGAQGEDIFDNYSNVGAAYIYRKNLDDYWNLLEKVTPAYSSNVDFECGQFGESVYCSNSSIIIGRPGGGGSYNVSPCFPPENFTGAVSIFTNYIYPCDRIIAEDDYHPTPGTYPEQSAGYITLGGNPTGEVYFQEGVDIAYVGGDILLLDGFTAAEGCSFTA